MARRSPMITGIPLARRVAQHHLVRPIRHGPRVVLPRADLEQRIMFDEPDE